MPISVATFYAFKALSHDQVEAFHCQLKECAQIHSVAGLIILGTEGINATISGSRTGCDALILTVSNFLAVQFQIKWSEAPKSPFLKFKVKRRDEIVTLGRPDIVPQAGDRSSHLSPAEWDRVLREEDAVCIDTRNWYETQMGKFKNALDPHIDEFAEFPEFVKEQGIPKDKKILIYCTGGIRCEKASLELKEQGYKEVYQLDGGILNYLAEKPNQLFEGECFVFDYRVAVDQDLKPTRRFKLCPHCGQPAARSLDCVRCDSHSMICVECFEAISDKPFLATCSKNCANHWELSPGKKGDPQREVQGVRCWS